MAAMKVYLTKCTLHWCSVLQDCTENIQHENFLYLKSFGNSRSKELPHYPKLLQCI